ncbi:hypothetical protein HQ524_04135, partial [Candidatus Uhrbacteria bacterium]|nr:hypothetical protein [Candidatus Uhrbacteria bacterium]
MGNVKNIFKKAVLTYMAGVLMLSSLVFALPASAQGFPVADAQLIRGLVQDDVEEAINKPLSVVIIQVLLNLISFVANRLAYDAAIAIASGGKGQTPGYEYRSAEEYGQDLFEDILGESIGQLSGTLGDIGINFDICAPTDPTKRLNLQLGIAGQSGSRPEPKCEFRSITSNWEGFIASSADNLNPDKIFKDFSTQFASGGSDLSANIIGLQTAINKATGEKTLKTEEMLNNKRFGDVTDAISGNVKTPSTVLEDQFKAKLNKAQYNESQALQDSLFGNEGALLQVGVSAGSVFLNTLLSQLTSKIY